MSELFSIIIVCLNPGNKLKDTLNSIQKQTYKDIEVIIKDGLSKDGSLDELEKYNDLKLKVYSESDSGIYDAMNQALEYSNGKYIYYLNCGDLFASDDVLEKVAKIIKSAEAKKENDYIFYGNIYERLTSSLVKSNPKIDGFACYRNVPCHQACFYKREFIKQHPFNTAYKVRADYEQFLWSFYIGKADICYMDVTVASYEGNGFSETSKGLMLSKKEHKEITKKYMTPKELSKYKFIMAITLSGIRSVIARNKLTAGLYNKIKGLIYK